jgi:glucose-6-phosphate isomerase
MGIKQNFYLAPATQAIIEKSVESQKSQLRIEKVTTLAIAQCELDSSDTELALIEKVALQILSLYNKAIIISIGGSMSASRAFTACKNYQSDNFKLIYSDSFSPEKQAEIFTKDNLLNSAIIVISRSGNSVETLYQVNLIIERYHQYFGADYSFGKHFFVITKGDNQLQAKGAEIGANIFEYVSCGGKFSALSMVGLLPARLIEMNPADIISGAKSMLKNPNNAMQAAWTNYHLLLQGYSINIMSHYNDLFDQILARYMQISSEITAKEGKGFSSIVSRGVSDQHGLWQLFLSGPRDKYFTFLCNEADFESNEMHHVIAKTYHQLSLGRLKEKAIPARELIIDKIDGYNLGELSMQFLLEMMILANLLDISSITQPDIDQSKKILGKMYARGGK